MSKVEADTYDYIPCWLAEGRVMRGKWEPNCYTMMQEGHLRYIIEQQFGKRDIPNVLELGAGFGRVTKIIKKNWKVAKYTAVDISPEQLEHIKRRWDTQVDTVLADITTLAENEWGHMTLVVCAEFLMHIKPEHIEKVLRIIRHAGERSFAFMEYYPIDEVKRPLSVHNFLHDYPALLEKVWGTPFKFHRIYSHQGIFWK